MPRRRGSRRKVDGGLAPAGAPNRSVSKTKLRPGHNVERTAWAATFAFLALLLMAAIFNERQILPGLAGICLGTASVLFAADSLVSSKHELRQGTFHRATEPVRFWIVTAAMAALGAVFLVGGVLMMAGMDMDIPWQ